MLHCIFIVIYVIYNHDFVVSVHVLQDPNQEAPEFEVPDTSFTLRVQDNLTDREVSHFSVFCDPMCTEVYFLAVFD